MIDALRSGIRHLRAQGLWVLLGRLYLTGGSLLSSVLFARLLTQEEYGAYRYVMTGIAMVAVLALPGAFEIVIRSIPRGRFAAYGFLFRLRLRFAFLSLLGFVAFCVYSFDSLETGEIVSLALIAALLPIYFTCQMYEAGYQAEMRFHDLSTIYIGRTTVQIFGYLGAYLLLGSVYYALVCMIASLTAYHLWNHRRLAREFLPRSDPAQLDPRGMTRDAVLISVFSVLPALTETLDKIFVQNMAGFDQLAIYSIGLALGMAINAFFKPFLNSINAKLVHKAPKIQHYMLVLIGGTLLGGIMAVAAPILVPLLYGEAYAQSVPLAVVILLSMGLFFTKTLFFNASMFNKDKKLAVVYSSNIATSLGAIGYMTAVVMLVPDPSAFLLWMVGVYPVKMMLSILSLRVFSRMLG